MTELRLVKTYKYFNFGDEDDYVVLDGGRVIGRIFLSPHAPPEHPWLWTITAPDLPPSAYNHGYCATRDQAMANFRARLTEYDYFCRR